MKSNRSIVLQILLCCIMASGAYVWANGIMDSLYAFRSPIRFSAPKPGDPPVQGLTNRLVFIIVDGLRNDVSHDSQVMPFLNSLRSNAAWATAHSRTPSYTAPGHSVLMTGAWPDVSDGPAMNLDYDAIPTWTQDNLFIAAHRAGLQTAIFGKNWYEKFVPQEAVYLSSYSQTDDRYEDQRVVEAALTALANPEIPFVLVHLLQVDYAGHYEGGPISAEGLAAAKRIDGHLEQLFALLDYDQDTVLITSDHGQIDAGGHGGPEPANLVEPFILIGSGVRPGAYGDIDLADIAPTASVLLGVNLPASAQGIVRTEMLQLRPEETRAVQEAEVLQKTALARNYIEAISESDTGSLAWDTSEEALLAMEQARSKRLVTERIPGVVLALFLTFAPAYWLVRRRNPQHGRMLFGALVYVALFNLDYTLVSGRTYSLSSVESANDIILFTAMNAAACLLLAWLVFLYVFRPFQNSRGISPSATMGFVLSTLYVLGIPILVSFAWNGATVTWILPEMHTFFLGFLSVLQALIVSVVGMLLVGLAALAAFFGNSNRRIMKHV